MSLPVTPRGEKVHRIPAFAEESVRPWPAEFAQLVTPAVAEASEAHAAALGKIAELRAAEQAARGHVEEARASDQEAASIAVKAGKPVPPASLSKAVAAVEAAARAVVVGEGMGRETQHRFIVALDADRAALAAAVEGERAGLASAAEDLLTGFERLLREREKLGKLARELEQLGPPMARVQMFDAGSARDPIGRELRGLLNQARDAVGA